MHNQLNIKLFTLSQSNRTKSLEFTFARKNAENPTWGFSPLRKEIFETGNVSLRSSHVQRCAVVVVSIVNIQAHQQITEINDMF